MDESLEAVSAVISKHAAESDVLVAAAKATDTWAAETGAQGGGLPVEPIVGQFVSAAWDHLHMGSCQWGAECCVCQTCTLGAR